MYTAAAITMSLLFAAPAPDVEVPGDPAAQAEADAIDPWVANVAGRLDTSALERFSELDDGSLEAIIERANRGEAISTEERAILDAIDAVAVEEFDAQLTYRTGDISIGDGLATLQLGDDFRYLGPEDARKVIVDAWKNPPEVGDSLGMIVPANVSPAMPDTGWGVVIEYSADGHVDDEDAEEIDYDELLEQMQKDQEAANPERERRGYAALHLLGWAEPPHYVGETHRLYWAQKLKADDAPEATLNYEIRVLGRKGVLALNAIGVMTQMDQIKPEMERVLDTVQFQQGNRYLDFDPEIDEVAAYGIGGLIAGKVLAKTGILAGLFKILLAAKKFLIVGVIALIAGIKGLLGIRKSKREDDLA